MRMVSFHQQIGGVLRPSARIVGVVQTEIHSRTVDLCILPSGRIRLRLLADEHSSVHLLGSPTRAMELIEAFLICFESLADELVLFVHDIHGAQTWSTRSRWAGLYWCATVLARIWPPEWVPVVERRGSRAYASLSYSEPPLIERRGFRRGPRRAHA
jgi:hypothetical protein